jgi:hypothetical protein
VGDEGIAELKIQGGRLLPRIHGVQEFFRLLPVRRSEALLFTGLIVFNVKDARAFFCGINVMLFSYALSYKPTYGVFPNSR